MHVRMRQQALQHELAEFVERPHADVQQVVRIARNRMRRQHLAQPFEEMREVLRRGVANAWTASRA